MDPDTAAGPVQGAPCAALCRNGRNIALLHYLASEEELFREAVKYLCSHYSVIINLINDDIILSVSCTSNLGKTQTKEKPLHFKFL